MSFLHDKICLKNVHRVVQFFVSSTIRLLCETRMQHFDIPSLAYRRIGDDVIQLYKFGKFPTKLFKMDNNFNNVY